MVTIGFWVMELLHASHVVQLKTCCFLERNMEWPVKQCVTFVPLLEEGPVRCVQASMCAYVSQWQQLLTSPVPDDACHLQRLSAGRQGAMTRQFQTTPGACNDHALRCHDNSRRRLSPATTTQRCHDNSRRRMSPATNTRWATGDLMLLSKYRTSTNEQGSRLQYRTVRKHSQPWCSIPVR